jgi:L-seryl-tRNA(Ser) seleniumtransferase
LTEIAAAAHARGVPVLVDAAAQLPPADNLHRFLEEGADLVAFSGGKAIGGPQASGILCGRADLVASAVIQMLDLDFEPEGWSPPEEFAALRTLRGLPHHGIGRSCKAGKEEVIGLLVALERFAAEASATRTAHWRAVLQAVLDAAAIPALRIIEDPDRPDVPLLALSSAAAPQIAARLAAGTPPIHCRVDVQRLLLSPLSLSPDDAALIGARLRAAIAA